MSLTLNTQAILLLTAPLIAGRGEPSSNPLTPGEYKRLAQCLRNKQRQPADLLAPDSEELLGACQPFVNKDRLRRLLARGFLLSEALDRWNTRAIWVLSHADANYPRRLKTRLKNNAPPILYGCGEMAILDTGGLAVVGSRHVDHALIEYTEGIGRLAARAGRTIVSGGARGIDQAAMRGALEADGKVVGVLANNLERAALNREHRNILMGGQLVLVSPYDPSAGFNVGHAMQRNKLIYALVNAALVVSSDYEQGGTWAGAVEQLEKLRFVPVYVRSNAESSRGLEALRRKGALPWPSPESPEALAEALTIRADTMEESPEQSDLFPSNDKSEKQAREASPDSINKTPSKSSLGPVESRLAPTDDMFGKAHELILKITSVQPKNVNEVADELQVSKTTAKTWLERLVKDGILEKTSRPVRYHRATSP